MDMSGHVETCATQNFGFNPTLAGLDSWAYFATKATNIQRHWRGFWSRKYLFDFYARKLYLRHVAAVNAQVRAAVAEEGERAAKSQKALAEAAARSAFETKVGSTSPQHLIF
eukprot:1143151-Pelagomonas_calceolata.AAC.2